MAADDDIESVAIIGMAARLPGAKDYSTFWRNLVAGVDSVSSPDQETLRAHGVPESLVSHPHHITAAGRLDDVGGFDADFFGFSPRQATALDPQHRLMLELGHECLEDAGYDPGRTSERIGVYGSIGMNGYLIHHLLDDEGLLKAIGPDGLMIANDKSFGVSRLSYKLNLRGPNVCIDTACSGSLVAVHHACKALLTHECDIALAGGVRILFPHWDGDVYDEGGILSQDGTCRAFDARANGTVPGSGGALVVLRRGSDALRAKDTIRAIILGTAINNDGADKMSYTAPSVRGQSEAIQDALAIAVVDPASVDFVEAHGTGTRLGDELELAALKTAYGAGPDARSALGAVKTNIGHLDVAAGVAGLVKAVLALRNGVLPSNLHCTNPTEHLKGTPFYALTEKKPWLPGREPRRAGVSSFGIGGTNAHAILEEAPEPAMTPSHRPWQTILLSAKTPSALKIMASDLANALDELPESDLCAAAFTTQLGRQAFPYRIAAVGRSGSECAKALLVPPDLRMAEPPVEIAFAFPGQGTSVAGMLSIGERAYEMAMREALSNMDKPTRERVRELLGAEADRDTAPETRTSIVQPALFAVEYSLAQFLMSLGIHPTAMIGHSLGEWVAACIAGVFDLETAIRLVCARGQLMESTADGEMLAVLASPEVLPDLAGSQCSLAAVNSAQSCVVSGPPASISVIASQLRSRSIDIRSLAVKKAFHSAAMDPIVAEFESLVASAGPKTPGIRFVSNVTGAFIQDEEAASSRYWGRQIREPVLFHDGIRTLFKNTDRLVVEVGPGRQLSSFVRRSGGRAISTVRTAEESARNLAQALGDLFVAGASVDWEALHGEEVPGRIPLPTYSFERKTFLSERPRRGTLAPQAPEPTVLSRAAPDREADMSDDLRQILRIWTEIFDRPDIGPEADFFAVGGDSLIATRVVSRIRDGLGVTITISDLFEAETPAGLATRIEASRTHVPASGMEVGIL